MIKEIIRYPTIPSQAFDGIVRHYDKRLFDLLQDLKETLIENNLEGLAAYQIGSPYAVIVIQYQNRLLELINPIIITKKGVLHPIETTAYYPNLTAQTKRYQTIKLMYEDREGKQHFLTAQDDVAILIQRKTDYLLGSDFRMRMSKEERDLFDTKRNKNLDNITSEHCPTNEPKTIKYILRMISFVLILGVIGAFFGLFVPDNFAHTFKSIANYIMLFVLLAIIVYFFVAKYEGKKYTHCTSCQIGNIIGTSLIQIIRLVLLALVNYFVFY